MKKFLIQVALGLLVFITINAAIGIFYQNEVSKSIQNKTHRKYLRWNDIHENKNAYDLIIIGTSRGYDSFNPMILDSLLNIKSYNMSTAAQDIAESYYSLIEIFEYQKPKYIIFDLYHEASDANFDYYQTLSNASFFNSTERRLKLISEGFGPSGMANYSIPLLRYKNHIKQDILNLFKEAPIVAEKDQLIKGYLHNTVTVTKKEISNFKAVPELQNTSFDTIRFTKYFNKIKHLSETNNAKLICVRAPYPPTRLKLSKIDSENNYFSTYTRKENITYFDLNNYLSNKYKYLDQDFSDYHHPNFRSAKKATMQLVEAIKKTK